MIRRFFVSPRMTLMLVCYIAILLSFNFLTKTTYAQDKNSDQIYSDFIQKYNVYKSQIDPYNVSKNQYLAYKSPDSEIKLIDSSKKLLISEIDSMIPYSQFLRSRLVEATNVLIYKENFLFIKLDDEIAYLTNHKKNISSLTSLEEIKTASNDLQNHYATISNYAFQIKAIIDIGSVEKIFNNIKVEEDKISSFLDSENIDQLRIKWANDKLISVNTEKQNIQTLINSSKALQNSTNKASDDKIVSISKEATGKIASIIAIFRSIINVLKTNL